LERGKRWLLTKADTRKKERISPASQEMTVSIRGGGSTSKGKIERMKIQDHADDDGEERE